MAEPITELGTAFNVSCWLKGSAAAPDAHDLGKAIGNMEFAFRRRLTEALRAGTRIDLAPPSIVINHRSSRPADVAKAPVGFDWFFYAETTTISAVQMHTIGETQEARS